MYIQQTYCRGSGGGRLDHKQDEKNQPTCV